ncbi:YdcH family protein [Sphingobium sp. DEHP117]|uniref:YdcH family protein n=1 Tax=Sphingobium sp. DEHP117 TaxID=2993436 RepID=UPI0027D74EC0|nr:DUF465 domain-containing protein [Sphingobium sp. DEHP117]MDQ4421206.1 YdcH family protein [Sphingobium sp. DEHP117]
MKDSFCRLLVRHQRLDEALRAEQRRPFPDFAQLQRLKRLKLRIKDRLAAAVRGRRILRPL